MSGEKESAWVHEFRRRISWALAPDHFRHGFVGDIVIRAEEQSHDPTYGDTIPGDMNITIDGICRCGERVYVSSDGIVPSADLIRRITEPDTDETMAQDTNPFADYQTEGEVR